MQLKIIGAALLGSCALFVASLGVAAPAQAIAISIGNAYVVEGNGVYTLVNNSTLYAYNFIVSNPAAGTGATPSTTQAGWRAFTCTGNCTGNVTGFEYSDSANANDIAPGQSSSRFFFNAAPASTYTIFLHDQAGNNGTSVSGTAQTGTVPEPATWALMMIGLGAAGTVLRRRRSSSVAA